MKQKALAAIRIYKDLDLKASKLSSDISIGDPMYMAIDYAGMIANVYIYKVINYVESKLR